MVVEATIARDQRTLIRAGGGRELADDAYNTICGIALGEGPIEVINTCMDLVSECRNNYLTIAQYVNGFMNTFTTAQRMGCKMPAFMATCILLSNLESELPTWTAPIRMSLPLANPDTLTNTDFYKYCDEAIATGNGLDAKHLAASAPIIQASTAPRDTKSDYWKKRTFPEPGVSPGDHVEKMRNQQPQRLNKKCAYCHIGGHSPLVCYHLNPSLRPSHWRLTRGLWSYNPPKESSKRPEISATAYKMQDLDVIDFSGMAVAARGNPANTWIYDTGSSDHLTPDLDSLTEYHELPPHEYYIYGTSERTTATAKSAGYTTIYLESPTGKPTALKIKAYYQPNLKYGLLSADRLRTDFNLHRTTKDLTLQDLDTDQTAGYLQISKNITFIRHTEPNGIAAAAPILNPLLLHRRLGHTGSHNIKLQNHEDFDCEACRLAKAKRLVSRDPIPRTADPTEL